ncbi:hypothetical protein CE91St9_03140 [Bacteroides thetaiotaomicron]|nr:hypothetical protein CE91St9_03140 [Bacteroides thetaiotaomicron]
MQPSCCVPHTYISITNASNGNVETQTDLYNDEDIKINWYNLVNGSTVLELYRLW